MNQAGPHHGKHGSPQLKGTQVTAGTPNPIPTRKPDPEKNATKAGAYTGRTMIGPGAQAQTEETRTHRP
jgi:hypothetical protein